jgi:hypothetical protein
LPSVLRLELLVFMGMESLRWPPPQPVIVLIFETEKKEK